MQPATLIPEYLAVSVDNCRTMISVQLPILVPSFTTVGIYDGRAMYSVIFITVIEVHTCPICGDFAPQ